MGATKHISADYVSPPVLEASLFIVDSAGGAISFLLPTPIDGAESVSIQSAETSLNDITITSRGSADIGGVSSYVLSEAGQGVTLKPVRIVTSGVIQNVGAWEIQGEVGGANLASVLALKAPKANPTFTGVAKAPMFATGFTTIATAAGTTVLTAASTQIQVFTGSTTQTVTLPVTSTLTTGFGFWIINDSSGAVTVNSSGGNAVQVIAANGRAFIECALITGTDAASWTSVYIPAVSTSIADGDTNPVAGNAVFDALALKIAITSVPYDIACQVTGKPDSAAVLLRFIAVRAFTLLAAGHKGTAGTGAAAEADFILAVNGTTKATLRFAIAGVTITIVGGTTASVAIGDIVTLVAPTQDAALSDLGFSLAGTLL